MSTIPGTTSLPHTVDRTVTIGAPPKTVFRYFTDDERWAAWWGAGSTIDARVGGRVYIRNPGGVEVSGEVLEIVPPKRLVFTYGFKSGQPIPPGASRVTIQLSPTAEGTRLTLEHAFAEEGVRDHHIQGWRYQLSVFANVVADEVQAGAAAAIDAWFGVWSITDADARNSALAGIAIPALTFRDRFGATDSVDDLVPHIGAAQQFMPGMTMTRDGNVRHCQGTALANWRATGPDGQTRGTGTNVFVFDPNGRIAAVTGLWS